jgi:ubiquinone/menaquinone biosynthesis C-methylase UbiE
MRRTTTDASRVREIYDQLASRYDRREALLEFLFLRRYRRQLLASAHGRVLEIGIGTGRNLPFYPRDCQITGIDLSAEMLRIADRRAARLGLHVTLRQLDAAELPFPAGSFDTVVSSLSLCTVSDPIQVLSEMSRTSARNGRILLLEHGRSRWHLFSRWPISLLMNYFIRSQVRRFGCHPDRNILALVQAADLVVLQVERHLLGGILHVIRARPPRSGPASK